MRNWEGKGSFSEQAFLVKTQEIEGAFLNDWESAT